jgi:F-type H+-transporting ATPase subunit c
MKVLHLICCVVVVFLLAAPAMAQDTAAAPSGPGFSLFSGSAVGAGIGAGIVLLGAGYGFGRIGDAALQSMGRQPEIAGRIQTAMIVIAALLEGATFFALLICYQLIGSAKW